ncbi:MAG TPA: BBP7 family outer membrane beta-barrel protein [Gemmatales bacterium]|nr:BBP7 family outer membrane beta-barrel protein [Gemmatales bacterium]HMP60110.1 BBP7 family outer membrane beta-barrel protein [Gemmatales bacterium]
MTKKTLGSLALLLAGLDGAHGQEPVGPFPGMPTQVAPGTMVPGGDWPQTAIPSFGWYGREEACRLQDQAWARFDLLMWWIKPGPNPVPLLTTGSIEAPLPGVLFQPGTAIVYGGSDLHFGTGLGGRLVLGSWLGRDRNLGIEGGGFALEQRSTGYSTSTDGRDGNPFLLRPFYNTQTGLEDVQTISFPGFLDGRFAAYANSKMWGAHADALLNLVETHRYRITGLVGWQYLNLREDLYIRTSYAPLAQFDGLPNPIAFNGGVIDVPGRVEVEDGFAADNQFHGASVGVRAEVGWGRTTLSATTKLGLGANYQKLLINGSTSAIPFPGAVPVTVPGGVLAATTNMGSDSRTAFAAVPQVELAVHVALTERITGRVGYSLIYWPSLIRPGDQIDRRVNETVPPSFVEFGFPVFGTLAPGMPIRTHDFWAHGVDFSFEVRF